MPEVHCGFSNIPGGATGAALLVYHGPTLAVDIGFDPNYQAAINAPRPVAGVTGIKALVDTGATESCIDSDLAAQLNLPIVDRRRVGGVHGALEVNIHLAQIHVPSLNHTIYGAFAGVHLIAGGQQHSALLGRTFLGRCTMTYNGATGVVRITSP
jgi:predicted aspartyl protease